MKFFLCGYYGNKNFGDEFLLYKIIEDIKKIDKNSSFYVWTTDKEFTKEFLQDFHIFTVDRFSPEETAHAIRECDVVVYGGGGLIQEHFGIKIEDIFKDFGKHIPAYSIPALMGNIYGKKVFYWGIGHGPVFTEEGLLFSKWFYGLADIIVLRDKYSFDSVKNLVNNKNIYMDIDPLFDFDFKKFAKKKSLNSVLGVSLRHGFTNKDIIKHFSQAIKEIYSTHKDVKFVFIPFDLKSDVEIIKELKNSVIKEGVPSERIIDYKLNTLYDIIDAINQCEWFVGMRLHSFIAANKLVVPFCSISYDIKTEELSKTLNIDYITINELSEVSISRCLNNLINNSRIKTLNQEYKTPEIFNSFLKEENLEISPEKMDKESYLKKNIKYAGNFISTLLLQINNLKKEIDGFTSKIRFLSQENNSIKIELRNLETSLSTCHNRLEKCENELDKQRNRAELYLQQKMDIEWKLENEIYNSNAWKLIKKYYKLRDSSFLKHLYPLYSPIADAIFKKNRHIKALPQLSEENTKHRYKLKKFVLNKENMVVIFSAIAFDELLNQRPLNLAKQFSKKGFSVLFVVWQWSSKDIVPKAFNMVYDRVLQIPIYDFINEYKGLEFNNTEKILYITFPHETIVSLIKPFREKGFKVIYDIMDDWEGFYQAGQASWYIKEFEEKAILESDYVTGINKYIVNKFSFLRNDIVCIGNGFDYDTVGKDAKFISAQNAEDVRMGYVGWLDKGRFDWDFVLEIADNFKNLNIELIGYGLSSDMNLAIEKFKNIKYLGKVHPTKLKNFVSNWLMGIIPFKEGYISKGADPLKIYQYIYFGLPTLVRGCDGILDYPLVFPCKTIKDVEKFYNNFNAKEKVIKFRDKHKENIDMFLGKTTWDSRIEYILKTIDRKTLWQ